ncbi:MAG: hypothetical protein ACSLFB_02175, partial [Acidimicrobiales bacterium]
MTIAMSSLSHSSMGRLGGFMFIGSSVAWPVVLILPLNIEGLDRSHVNISCAAGFVIGLFALIAPWDRWPRPATLSLAAAAFVVVAVVNTFSATIPQGFGAMFTTTFAWIGIAHPRGTASKFAIPAALLFVIAILRQPGPMGGLDLVPAVVIVIPVGILVGEVLAWMSQRLRDAEQVDQERLTGVRELMAVSETLSQQHEPQSLPTLIAEIAIGALKANAALVTFLEADGSLTSMGSHQWPIPAEKICLQPWNIPALHEVLTLQTLPSKLLSTIVYQPDELGVPSALAIAIRGSGDSLGVLFLTTDNPDDPFLNDLANTYATQAGLALERSWATQTLIDATLRDELTDIGNRRHATSMLARLQVGDAVAMID